MKTETFNEEEILICLRHYLTSVGYWGIKDMEISTDYGGEVSVSVSYEKNIYNENED